MISIGFDIDFSSLVVMWRLESFDHFVLVFM